MSSYIALLRAVNVAGSAVLRMEDLRRVVEGLGFEDVRTLLQSGNLVFRGAAASTATLETRLERELGTRLRLTTELFVRTSREWKGVVAENPYLEEAKSDPAHLTVAFLKEAPRAGAWSELRAAIRGRERVTGSGRHAYIVYPDGIGRSRLTAAVIERQLGTRTTSRNWNTILKLEELAPSG